MFNLLSLRVAPSEMAGSSFCPIFKQFCKKEPLYLSKGTGVF